MLNATTPRAVMVAPEGGRLSIDNATLDLILGVGDDPHEVVHEAHGGDENPDREDCMVCIADLDFFLRHGASRPVGWA